MATVVVRCGFFCCLVAGAVSALDTTFDGVNVSEHGWVP